MGVNELTNYSVKISLAMNDPPVKHILNNYRALIKKINTFHGTWRDEYRIMD
jgi:hypothetical protein